MVLWPVSQFISRLDKYNAILSTGCAGGAYVVSGAIGEVVAVGTAVTLPAEPGSGRLSIAMTDAIGGWGGRQRPVQVGSQRHGRKASMGKRGCSSRRAGDDALRCGLLKRQMEMEMEIWRSLVARRRRAGDGNGAAGACGDGQAAWSARVRAGAASSGFGVGLESGLDIAGAVDISAWAGARQDWQRRGCCLCLP